MKIIASLLALLFGAALAHAQPVPSYGPGPVPSPWAINGPAISYGGCVLIPASVTGGCQGNGTLNIGALYINGAPIAAGANVVGPSSSTVGHIATWGNTSGTSLLDSGKTLPSGAIVGTTDAQTLTNKSISASQVNSGTLSASQLPAFSGAITTSAGSSVTTLSAGAAAANLGPGISGGIPYWSSTSAISSSAALTANAIVLGGGAGTAPSTLGSLGTTTTVLHGNASGAPTFGAVALGTDVSGTLPAANGGTGNATYASGDILYASGTTTLSRLAKGTNSQVLTLVSGLPAWASSGGSTSGLIGVQVWNTHGTFTYTPTAGAGHALVFVTGAGGGSGGIGSLSDAASGAGGAGATTIAYATSLTTTTVTIGTGGPGGASGANAGAAGGASSFGTVSANGGGAGAAGTSGTTFTNGGLGSTVGSGGLFVIPGGNGSAVNAGYGGWNGGASFWGGGGSQTASGGQGTSNAGMAPGSGAGGAQTVASTSLAGAAGADGMVLVLEFP